MPDQSEISVKAVESSGELLLSIDGQESRALSQGDSVVVRRADAGVNVIHLPGYDYFAVLRQKLRWRGSNV